MSFQKIPRAGEFYHHLKHDPNDFFSYLYVVVGLSLDTEEGNLEVVYAPLYDTDQELFNRDLNLFIGTKEVDGKEQPRFRQVTAAADIKTIRQSGRLGRWRGVLPSGN